MNLYTKILGTATMIVAVSLLAKAQKGKPFPYIEGETLTNQQINIPNNTKGKFTLIGMAYSKKSEDELKSWFNPVYQTFIHKPSTPGLFTTGYDVNVYFIPMFTGAKKAAYKVAMKKMRSKTDPKLIPHIMFYKGELKKYKEALDFERKDTPYFFVLDKEGNIVHATSGKYSGSKMEAIEELLEEW
ncbi:hypothetical protein QQ008_11785 [Fulvivirgaceae bacterium BMA10]|uniref:Thioredoxin domain-containing protein n=1 Tax=Splendidivirga corallicola TaxID=3051826 RepID=A0ABT8KQV0_9BACT|nr:hypothetical protein [Fulvivirgaceae bacterium BMA10]